MITSCIDDVDNTGEPAQAALESNESKRIVQFKEWISIEGFEKYFVASSPSHA